VIIPRVYHRIWLDEQVPRRFEDYWDRFKALHPSWEFVTWDDSSQLGWMRTKALFDRCQTWAGKADLLRYEIMLAHGGVYVDTDVEPLRPFDPLLDDDRPFAAWEKDRVLLCPTVLGSPPGHPAFAAVLDYLPGWFDHQPGTKPNYQTGPVPFTRVWRRRRDVRRLPRETFYPVLWWERERLGGPYPPESYCVHHWVAGWKAQTGVPW